MDERLKQLVFQVQQHSHETQKRQEALTELVEQILRSRPICRPLRGQSLGGIYLKIVQAVQQQLQDEVEQSIDHYNFHRLPVRDWANGLRDKAFQQVLDNSCLTQLALETQQYQPRTEQWQYAVRELLQAIRLSGKLSHKSYYKADIYEDAVTRTLLWVCQNLSAYNPSKGKFMAWVNYRLDMILREIQQEAKDPFIQSIEGKIIRRKYQLNVLLKKANSIDLKSWLMLWFKQLISPSNPSWNINLILILSLLLSQLIQQNPPLGDSILFEIAKESIPFSSRFQELAGETKTLEDIAQPEEKPFLSETVRQYLEEDPGRLFQKHIRENPQATFQAIALARLDGKTWKEMSEAWGIGIPALNNFFQRRLKELAPEIRKYVQEQCE